MPFNENRVWDFQPGFHKIGPVFDADECRRIIALSDGRQPITSRFDGRYGNHRDSELYWLAPDSDAVSAVYVKLRDAALAFNRSTYRFEIDGCMDLQLTCYKPGGHYNWHADLAKKHYSRRKLSLSVLLSAPESFRGGAIQFFESEKHMPAPDLERGEAVAFPSWLKHRVRPVTEGERWSLVAWWTGPPFR